MTKLRLMSDVHCEHGSPIHLEPAGEDILILAGDIGTGTRGFDWAEEYAERAGVPVVYVAGNHEFYGQDIDKTIADLCWRSDHSDTVTFFHDRMAEIGGVCFCGGTLWTDYALDGAPGYAAWMATRGLNDHRLISENNHPFRPEDALERHRETHNFIRDSVFDYVGRSPLVVITHHLPSRKSLNPIYERDALNPCYASNLDELVEKSGAALWIHGHVHCSNDYMIGKTRVVSNPAGYPERDGRRENPRFDPTLIIEV